MSRRALLAGGAGLVLSACSTARHVARPAAPGVHRPGALPTTTPPTPTTVPVGSKLTKVPTVAIPAATKPAFYVDNIIASPPPTAVALTIDDGPDPRYTPEVLAVLAAYGAHATFSVVGTHANRYPSLLVDMLNQGHSLTNHSMTHPQPFANLPPSRLQTEVVGGLEAIYDATGYVTSTFRSPGGDWSPAVYALLGELGMTPIDWDVDPRDYTRPGVAYITCEADACPPGRHPAVPRRWRQSIRDRHRPAHRAARPPKERAHLRDALNRRGVHPEESR